MEYGIEDLWYGMEMEWKKIASMEYGKIIFHSIPCPGCKQCKNAKVLHYCQSQTVVQYRVAYCSC